MASAKRPTIAALMCLLAVWLAPGACSLPDMMPGSATAGVPRAVVDDPPEFEIVPPDREVPPELARFSGLWVADGVDGAPKLANGRTIIAVTYVAADGQARLERAETTLGGLFGNTWGWRVTERNARIVRGVLAVDAGRWMTLDGASPPILREHFIAGTRSAESGSDSPGLVFSRSPP